MYANQLLTITEVFQSINFKVNQLTNALHGIIVVLTMLILYCESDRLPNLRAYAKSRGLARAPLPQSWRRHKPIAR